MDKHLDLASDKEYQKAFKLLGTFAFHQKEKIGDLFPTVYILMKMPENRRYYHYLNRVFRWFLIASSLWPTEFVPVVNHLVQLIKKGEQLPPLLILILKFSSPFPPKALQRLIKRREHMAHNGQYEDLVRNNDKFLSHDAAVKANPEVHKDLEMLKAAVDISQYANPIGVVRRYMVAERGFRNGWKYDPNDTESMMRTALTSMSAKYDLYGFQNDIPLVMKFTVNATGFGTLMFTPKYQATDLSRDVNRKNVGAIPKAWGVAGKGAKALAAKREREDEAIRTYFASMRADEFGYLGEPRRLYIIEQAGLGPQTHIRQIRKLIVTAKELLGIEE